MQSMQPIQQRTRIKICGLTRMQDVQAVVAAGVDAIGFVFYPQSPRYVEPKLAAELIAAIPPFITTVGLFVNASGQEIAATLAQVPVSLLQFHGDEIPAQCHAIAEQVQRPFIRAMRVKPEMTAGDLLHTDQQYRAGSKLWNGLLLDTFVDAYGGSGKTFDWSIISKELAPCIILSGGLSVQNVADAIQQVRPYAVDISSGVELAKGIKDIDKIRAFVRAVRQADAA